MARSGISTILTAVVAGAAGFALGVYEAPNEGVSNLRSAIEARLQSFKDNMKKSEPATEAPAEAPSTEAPATSPEAAAPSAESAPAAEAAAPAPEAPATPPAPEAAAPTMT
ncbi:MAG: hypothetical protein ACKOPC_04115, partial [Methylocystis sp.]